MVGRLTLSWAHKGEALIDDGAGGYSWVDPRDPRAAEVRLLNEVSRVGDVSGTPSDNLLVEGDGLHLLKALANTPEYAKEFKGKIKLAYIDPPFNTGQAFEHYDDGVEHSIWLGLMRERLELIRDLLAADGSVWVHLDDAEMAYARVLMDELFGRSNFVATIVWQRTTSSRNDSLTFSASQDYILVFARDASQFDFNRLRRPESADTAYKNPDNDPRGPWREIDYKVAKTADERPNLYYPLEHPVTHAEVWPRRERVWAYGRATHAAHVRDDLLFWGLTGNYRFPKLKKFLSSAGDSVVPDTLWLANDVDTTRRAKAHIKTLFPDAVPFATPKPERLLERIIHIATNPGDVVLDVFGGSGTTAATAHKTGRRWVTAEREASTISAFIRPRLAKVVAGEDPDGITGEVSWTGGGGFRELVVAEPVYQMHDLGGFSALSVVQRAGDETLARSVAAQLGFTYEPDEHGLTGRRGRSRLAVVAGNVDEGVIESLLAAIDEDELLHVAAKTASPGAREYLRAGRPGSRIELIPSGLFASGGVTR